ncbi:MAG: amino acid ABC transporter permease [Nocardioidaceae bacterium]|jgi:polar amino acid transport system permease protein|nr:amino acid ABC transporter permease [Nocardioidaceae bacterium]
MTASELVRDDLQQRPTPSKPRPVGSVAVIGLILSLAGILLMIVAAVRLRDYNGGGPISTVVGLVLVIGSLYPLWPSFLAFKGARERSALLRDDQLVMARRAAAGGREEAQIAMGYAAAAIVVAGLLLMAFANDGGIAQTFFTADAWRQSFPQMIRAFWTNIWVAIVAQILVLAFGLLLAIMRMLPGRGGAPLRLISLVYCDIFRAIPAIVTILLIVFGTPLAFPVTAQWSPVWLGIIALSMTYSAYVAEVYRAGLSSIHPSQSAAARSLGLSYTQTLRTVLVPQAVRRVIPPLLNDFISLQKDTALLSTAAIAEVVLTSTLWQSQLFNLSPVTLAAAFFIIITIPQARFVDYLIHRDAARRAGQ